MVIAALTIASERHAVNDGNGNGVAAATALSSPSLEARGISRDPAKREFEDWRDNMTGYVETTLDKYVRASERRLTAEIQRSGQEIRKELNAKIDDVRTELLAKIEAAQDEFRTENRANRREIVDMRAEMREMQGEIREMKADISSMKADIHYLHQAVGLIMQHLGITPPKQP